MFYTCVKIYYSRVEVQGTTIRKYTVLVGVPWTGTEVSKQKLTETDLVEDR